MPKVQAILVPIVARVDKRWRTYLQQITGPNANGAKSKTTDKVYEFAVTYVQTVGETATERLYKVGDGVYALCQPNEELTKGREMTYFVVDKGNVATLPTGLEAVRVLFKMPAKAAKATKAAIDIPANAIRF